MPKKLIPYAGLADKGIQYSRSQLSRRIREGTFPKPVQLGLQRVAWVESELDAWIEQRIAQRDAA